MRSIPPAVLVAALVLTASACDHPAAVARSGEAALYTDDDCTSTDPCGWPEPPGTVADFKYWSGGVDKQENFDKWVDRWAVSQSAYGIESSYVSMTVFLRDRCDDPATVRRPYTTLQKTVAGSPAWSEVKFVSPRWTGTRKQQWDLASTHRFVPYSWSQGGGEFTTARYGRCF